MNKFQNHFIKLKKSTKGVFVSSKKSVQNLASDFKVKFHNFKDYTKSDAFEDDIDQVILRLQMFDTDLVVPNMDNLKRNQRVTRKMKLIKRSFERLNLIYGPIGATAGGLVFGPQGAAAGAPLGSYIFGACILITVYERTFPSPEGEMAPASI